MQHEFTDAQILYAADDATEETTSSYKAVGLPYLRAFLNSLPDQPGDDALREQAGLYKDLLEHPFFKDWSISGTSIRSFMMNKLDSAMTPQDDWQECTADDLQYGDIYRAESSDANIAYKQPITKCTIVGDWVDVQHEGGMKSSARIASNTFYRIPVTIVQHPYPLDHPAIVVIEADGYEDTNPQVFVWTGNRYENDAWCFDADDITSWKTINPAKVVADND